MSAIVCSHVDKAYGATTVIRDLNLSIEEHEFVVFLGPSGCGKSTLLRMLAGLEDISSGEVSIGGKVVNDLDPGDRGIAMVFQNYALYPHMTIFDNIAFGLRRQKVPAAEIGKRVEAVSRTLGLEPYLGRKPTELSGGQQQRVAIARAMMQQPKVLLADEPIASLDPLNAKVVMDSLRDINLREGITVVTNLHTLDTARAYCNRIIGMAAGKVVFDGAPEDLDRDAVRTVYGADANGVDISEAITSTSVSIKPKITASAGPLEPAFPGY
ncbi:MAG: ABC transporter ATP-binding protein [Mesorhizobium sp.]|nr:MAG: ABC transporter ATP-binding protein [Mesorhizobium sp.]